ncbi:LysM peptidoglycan-binding domain-containing protein [Loktanella sp. Alg231-35]|uniref:LysM peptidoglycan-binding domain-containing protein n=1 Tax=Loktanella sp. Alg231-35 TaxID=1922220 RepID=UPI000D54C9CB|nr:LysM peptidoglycan-binding domain-containing protein [Loktanella sp. Alg231-35]
MSEDVKSTRWVAVLGGIVAVGVAIVVIAFLPKPQIEEVAAVAPAPETGVAEAPEIAEAPEAPAPEVQAEAPEEPAIVLAPVGPEFDTFRVEPDGSMVIAGRAEPGQFVDIMLGGEAIERVQADGSGNFVALLLAGPSDTPRRLSLVGDPDGAALESTTSYIVAPIVGPAVVAAAPAEEDTAPASDAAEVAETQAEVPAAPELPEVDLAIAAPAPPPTVLQADEAGVRVVQGGPALNAPQVDPNVALDAITYDPEGEVRLSGRATGDGAVQVYIDNEPVTTSSVTEGGDWQIDLPSIDTGVYTLRIDEVDEKGVVVSRLETPFKREEAEDVAAVLAEETSVEGFEVAVKTVQPGATLWAIAEENLGSGIFYVEVFEANSDLIRDPDLIYPGQIFRMPEISQ